jgi:cytochrome c biogenesis protein CcmG/thiol:disulfide interchange protein DsbE
MSLPRKDYSDSTSSRLLKESKIWPTDKTRPDFWRNILKNTPMNYLLQLLFVGIVFTACELEPSTAEGFTQEADSKEVQEASALPAPKSEEKKVKPIWVKRDTTKPPTRRSNYMVSTSRSAKDIKSEYPYDIDLKKADGSIVRSDKALAQNGKPTVLAFWLTTCVPCRYELGEIQKKFAGWKEQADFNFYAISTDFPKNYEKFVERVEEMNWPWEAYNDVNREFMEIMPGRLNGLPQTFILDTEGNIVYHTRKYRFGDEDALFAKLMELNPKK